MRALALLAAVVLPACGFSPAVSTFRDAKTIHSPDASRVWIILRTDNGSERIVFCESTGLAQGRQLCVHWPPEPQPRPRYPYPGPLTPPSP